MKKVLILSIVLIIGLLNITEGKAEPPVKQEIEKIFQLVEKNIANPHWLKTEAYLDFKEKMLHPENLALDLPDYLKLFNRERHHLPFTHLYLSTKNQKKSTASPQAHFEWKAVEDSVAYLDINNFAADAAGMLQIVQEIEAGQFGHLIIDLRGNTGGTLDAAVVLGQYLTKDPIDAGVYLTRNWYEKHTDPAAVAEYSQFPFLQDMTYEGFMKMVKREQGFRMVLPGHNRKVFTGKVYILTDGITASACEPFVYLLKKIGRAELVGSTTAGAMLSGQYFSVSDNLRVFLPVADFLTASGTRIDKIGVQPKYEVAPDRAYNYVLEALIKQ